MSVEELIKALREVDALWKKCDPYERRFYELWRAKDEIVDSLLKAIEEERKAA